MSTSTPNFSAEELLKPEGMLQAAMAASPVALIAVDERGCIRFMNAEAEGLSGRTTGELAGRSLETVFPGRLRGGAGGFFTTQTGASLNERGWVMARSDGGEVVLDARLSWVPAAGGERVALLALTVGGDMAREVAARRMQSEALVRLAADPALVAGDFVGGVRRLTEVAVEALGADRAGVWLLDDFGRTLVCADLFVGENKLHALPQALSRDLLPGYFSLIEERKTLAVADARTDARVAELRAPYFEPEGVRATLDSPVRVRGRVVGVLCIEQTEGVRAWTADERAFAGSLADQAALLWLQVEHAKTERSAREATERLQEIFSNTTEGIFSLRVTGAQEFVFEEFNPAAEAIGGVPAVKVCGRRPQDVFPAELAVQLNDNYRRCLEAGVPVEYVERAGFGREVGFYHTFLIPIRGADGRIHRIAGFARDVTEQTKAEEALRTSEEKFSKAFRSSPDAISVSDAQSGRFIEINEGFEKLFGRKAEELIGKTSLELELWGVPGDRERLLAALQATGSVKNFEAMAKPRSGAQRPCLVAAETVEIGGRACLVLVIRDVTEQREAERALRESEARFRSYFESPSIGMAITAPDRRWLEVNDQLCQMLGYTREELRRMRWTDLTVAEDLARNEELVERTLAGEMDSYSMEKGYRRKDGGLLHASIAVRCMRKPDGTPDYFLTVVQDQTARIEAERAQAELETQLRQAQKLEALGQLAGGIAHDFNNILTAIMAYAELAALDAEDAAEVRSHLEQVQIASNRARDLVRRILTFSRLRKQERKPLRLNPVIEEALSLIRSTLPATIAIRARLESDAPVVLADGTQVHQVLMNLCTNSGYAMREKPGSLDVVLERVRVDAALVRAHPELREGWYARLSVNDTGSGMPAEVVTRVFEPFFTTKAPGEGTGLGLSVVHGIMQDHEGAVLVESVPGSGTTVSLYFPEQLGEAETRLTEEKPSLRGRGERVLFVDDEQALCDSTRRLLDRLGYQAEALSSPVAALELFKQDPRRFDLVVTDLTMPFMTGVELAREMIALNGELPVLLASGFSGSWTEEKVREQGLRGLILKPVTAAALSAAIRHILDASDSGIGRTGGGLAQ